jgi:hypothetical protein
MPLVRLFGAAVAVVGLVERKVKPQPAVNAAAYLSSYFVKGKRDKQALWESVQSPQQRSTHMVGGRVGGGKPAEGLKRWTR